MDVSNCRNLIENLLSSYTDGELDSQNSRILELHMQVCPPCTAFLRTFLATKAIARKQLVSEMPSACGEAIWGYLEQELQLKPEAPKACGCTGHHSTIPTPAPESSALKR